MLIETSRPPRFSEALRKAARLSAMTRTAAINPAIGKRTLRMIRPSASAGKGVARWVSGNANVAALVRLPNALRRVCSGTYSDIARFVSFQVMAPGCCRVAGWLLVYAVRVVTRVLIAARLCEFALH